MASCNTAPSHVGRAKLLLLQLLSVPPLQAIEAELEELKAQSKVIRVLVHTQIKKINNWGQKKSHMLEVQVSAHAATLQLHLLAALLTPVTAACT
jgi:ribosomal protein L3